MMDEIDVEMNDAIESAMQELDEKETAHRKLMKAYLVKLSNADDDSSLESELVRARRLITKIRELIGEDGELVSLYYKTHVCRSLLGPLMRGVAQSNEILDLAVEGFELPISPSPITNDFPITSFDW